jgi:isopenicillin N synthase-like dioxygenase
MADGVAAEDVQKFVDDGFALINASPRIQQALGEVFSAGSSFFRGDLNEKMRSRLSRDSGYRPHGAEYSQSPSRPDEVESYTVSYRIAAPNRDDISHETACLNERMLDLFDLLEPIAEAFAIQLADKLTGNTHRQVFRGALHISSILQLNYSRPADVTADFINETHEDGCLFTISSVTAAGLELETLDHSFVPITPSNNSLLIMSGEILWLLSGGLIRPVYHRVRPNRKCEERMSLLYFADLHPKLCRPWIRNHINEAVDIGDRVLTNSARFGLAPWTPEEE